MPKSYLTKASVLLSRELSRRNVKNKALLKQDLVIVFLNKKEAQKINLEYRSKNYATDVLSFSGTDQSLGELVMCPEILKKQAKQNNHNLRTEILYMFIHGVLHLLGYDHEKSKSEAYKMFKIQDEVFEKIKKPR